MHFLKRYGFCPNGMTSTPLFHVDILQHIQENIQHHVSKSVIFENLRISKFENVVTCTHHYFWKLRSWSVIPLNYEMFMFGTSSLNRMKFWNSDRFPEMSGLGLHYKTNFQFAHQLVTWKIRIPILNDVMLFKFKN